MNTNEIYVRYFRPQSEDIFFSIGEILDGGLPFGTKSHTWDYDRNLWKLVDGKFEQIKK